MKKSTLFDIISPVMVGPSSSHTAGAVRLGLLARNIYKNIPQKVTFKLYNSYAHTGKGHGTEKGLLAGLYELPNLLGHLTREEVLDKVKNMQLEPLYIEKLPDAKHIFSHVEWHMKGYTILIEEPEQPIGDLVFVEAADAKERYAVPSAFSAYWNAIKESVEPEA